MAACANDMTAPAIEPQAASSLSAVDDSAGPWRFGRHGAMGWFMARRLPANLQLTTAQRAQMKALMTTFGIAHQSELAAMRTSMRSAMQQARAARASGQTLSIDQRRAIFQQTAPVRQRLISAQRELATRIQNVLTSDQKAWLASHRPLPCANRTACRAQFARRGPRGAAQMRNPS